MVELQSDSTPPGALPLALIVGDAPRGSGWLRYLLEANGYGALTLNSGREALAIARGAPIDVIAIDMQLSDMDGVTLCRLLRDDVRVSAATPLLLVSPSPLLGTARLEGLRAGAWDCVDPATHPEDLLLRVQAFVRGRRESERQRGAGAGGPRLRGAGGGRPRVGAAGGWAPGRAPGPPRGGGRSRWSRWSCSRAPPPRSGPDARSRGSTGCAATNRPLPPSRPSAPARASRPALRSPGCSTSSTDTPLPAAHRSAPHPRAARAAGAAPP